MKNFILLVICFFSLQLSAQVYQAESGQVHFISDAPLELIQAKSDALLGLFNVEKKVFAFKLNIVSFKGFNSPLQQTHFYENYMETKKYPLSTFQGKIIEDIDLSQKNTYRAKGKLEIHGISREVIIDVELMRKDQKIFYDSNFQVNLSDFEIDLPRIVYQKIAENIAVHVSGQLMLQQ